MASSSSSDLQLLKIQSILHCYTTLLQQAPGSEEWEEWGQMEEFSVKVEPSSNSQQTPVDEDLFHDMTPVFQKPKKVSENFKHMLITVHIRRGVGE